MTKQAPFGPARGRFGLWLAFASAFGLLVLFNAYPATNLAAAEEPAAEEADDDGKTKDGMSETFAADPGLATLYVAREKKFKGSAVKKKVYLNNAFAAKIGNGRYAVFRVEPGEYLAGVLEESDKRSLTLTMEAGKVYFAQLKIKMGIAKARGALEVLGEKDGQALVRTLNRAKAEDYADDEETPAEPE